MKKSILRSTCLVIVSSILLISGCQTQEQRTNTDQQIVKTLKEQAKPLQFVEPQPSMGDLQPLRNMVKDTSIVGLGEATHGTSEIYQTKNRLVQFLVTEMGFTNVVLEIDWGTGMKLNKYIQTGKGNPKQPSSPLLFQLLNQSKETLDMIHWMRDYNANPINKKKIQLYGMDITSVDKDVYDEVRLYVKKTQPDLLDTIEKNYKALEPHTPDPMKYVQLPDQKRKQFMKQAQAVVQLLNQHKKQLEQKSSSEEFAFAKQNATIITQVTQALLSSNPKDSFDPHDKFMADNVTWIKESSHEKTIVWAHNAHISKGLITSDFYNKMSGQHLAERYGPQYTTIGTSVFKGNYNVVGNDQKIHQMSIKNNTKSYNQILGKVPYNQFILDLRQSKQPLKLWLEKKRPFLSGTAGNDPSLKQYANISLAEQFDVLVHMQKSTAAHYE